MAFVTSLVSVVILFTIVNCNHVQHAIFITENESCVALTTDRKFVLIQERNGVNFTDCSVFPVRDVGRSRFKIYSPLRNSCLTGNAENRSPTWTFCIRKDDQNSKKSQKLVSTQIWSKRLVNKSSKRKASVCPSGYGFTFNEDSTGLEVHILDKNSTYVENINKKLFEERKQNTENRMKNRDVRAKQRKKKVVLIAFLVSLLVCLFCILLVILVLRFC